MRCLDMSVHQLTQPRGLVDTTWPLWTCLGAWHLTMARAGSRRGRFGHGRYQVPDVSLKVEEERAR